MISENYYHIIREFISLLQENNIHFFPIAGTLLGIYREGKVLDHDDDVDIAIDIKDAEKFKKLILKDETWHFHMIWRREACVLRTGYGRKDSQIDVFFMEEENNNYYLFDYEINDFSGVWDIERKLTFKKEWFKTFDDVKFVNKTIQIPHQADKILTAHYGNWRETNKQWKTSNSKIYDKKYREIAILIPTFIRDECLFKLVHSITSILPKEWYRIYIGDQGCYCPKKEKLYKELEQEGHKCYFLPFNSGLARVRNFLITQTVEPYILLVDDDFEFTEETKIQNFIDVFLTDENIGIVGGSLKDHSGFNYNIIKQDKKLYYVQFKKQHYFQTIRTIIKKTIPYVYCDVVLNFALFKKEVFEDGMKWDSELKLVEHTDFYLRLKELNKWNVAFTPTVIAAHPKKINSLEYVKFRKEINVTLGLGKFENKWDIKYSDVMYLKEI